MEIYSAYRRPNSQKSNTPKNEVYIKWKLKKKKPVLANSMREKVKNDDQGSFEQWMARVQKRWAVLREKVMEYFFPESVV